MCRGGGGGGGGEGETVKKETPGLPHLEGKKSDGGPGVPPRRGCRGQRPRDEMF